MKVSNGIKINGARLEPYGPSDFDERSYFSDSLSKPSDLVQETLTLSAQIGNSTCQYHDLLSKRNSIKSRPYDYLVAGLSLAGISLICLFSSDYHNRLASSAVLGTGSLACIASAYSSKRKIRSIDSKLAILDEELTESNALLSKKRDELYDLINNNYD